MATLDTSQQVHPDSEAQLDQSRSAGTEHVSKSSHDKFVKPTGSDDQEVAVSSSYDDVSEEVPPQHKIHSDSELLPQPKSSSSEEELPKADDSTPEPTESYEDAHATQPPSHFDATKPDETVAFPPNEAVYDRSSFGNIRQDQDKSIDSEVAAASTGGSGDIDHQVIRSELPIDDTSDTKVTDRGYGVAAQEASEPDVEAAATEHPAKKEGFMAKMMEKMPGHHHKAPPHPTDMEVGAHEGHHHKAPPHPTDMEVGAHDESGPLEHHASTDSPKKGMMEKIKEKFPGHHTTHAHATDV